MTAQSVYSAEHPIEREWPWARLTAGAGLAFVALTVAAFAVSGADPDPTAPLDQVRAYFVDHRGSVLAGVYLDSLAMTFFLAFAAGLGALIGRRAGDGGGVLARLMVAGAVGTGAITLVENMAEAALAFQTAAAGEPAAIRALFDFYLMVNLSSFPLVVFLIAAAAGILRTAVVPRWLGWAALVQALLLLVGAAGLGNPRGALASVGFVGGFLSFVLWTLVISVILLVQQRAIAPARQRQPV